MPSFTNTYYKLDRDTVVDKYDNKSYYDLVNFRLLSEDSLHSGALSLIKGNTRIFTGLPGASSDIIIGSKKLRDYQIFFSTISDSSSPSGNTDHIWKAPLSTSGLSSSDFTLLYSGDLGFSRYYPIEDIVTFYENENIQKVYWTDNYNYLRYCNIADSDLSLWTADQFNIVQNMDMSTPILDSISSGSLPVGMVQYSYRLYKLYGPTSNFAPASQMIPITQSSESLSNSLQYKGSDYLDDSGSVTNSGKSFTIKIENVDTDYDRIEVVAIYYSTINSTPTINIVTVAQVASTVYITDDGSWDQGTYSLDEYLYINNPFKCKSLDTDRSILFAANIQQSEYNPDYDARAYRWDNNWSCYLWEKDGTYWYNNAVSSPLQWTHYTAGGSPITQVYGMENLPISIDAINKNNIQYNKAQLNGKGSGASCKYTYDVLDLGGMGPNTEYFYFMLKSDTVYMDDSANSNTFYQKSASKPYYYDGIDSPYYNQDHTSWARDETYRMGVVLWDTRGRPSPPKWISDIRMPNMYEDLSTGGAGRGFFKDVTSGGNHYSQALPFKVQFDFINLPSDCAYVQVVYVPREEKDKTVVAQGKIGFFREFINTTQPRLVSTGKVTTVNDYNSSINLNKDYVTLISPEISFYKNFVQGSDDYLEIINTIYSYPPNTFDDPYFHQLKYTLPTWLSSSETRWISVNKSQIEEAPITPDVIQEVKYFDDLKYSPGILYNPTVGNFNVGDLGTCLLLHLDSNITTTGFTGTYWMMGSYRKNLFGSQYGGNSYEDRARNVYIPAGPPTAVSGGSATAYAEWGDVWIGFHDQLTGYYNEYYQSLGSYNSHACVEYFPCETTVNLSYRNDDCFHKIYSNSPNCYFIREKGNDSFTLPGGMTDVTAGDVNPNWSDLYLINTVYCRRPDARKFYAPPIDYDETQDVDTLIMASDTKQGRETIDPWTIWRNNETIQVDNSFGPVNKIITWKNQLLYFQEDNMGVLSVLDRSVVSDQTGKVTVLGQGDILSRYDTIQDYMGLSTRFSVVRTPNAIYWYDDKRRTLNRFTGNIKDISTVTGMNSYFQGISNNIGLYDNTFSVNSSSGQGFFMTYNPKFKEVWFTIKNTIATGETLIYNEVMDSFTGFIKNQKAYYQTFFDKQLFSTYDTYLYEENTGDYGKFYDVVNDSYITFIVNPLRGLPVTFTNYEFTSELYDGDTQIHDQTITSYQVENDYQDTGELAVSSSNSRRLLRSWHLSGGRNSSDNSRLRDKYAKVTLTYENDANNYNLVLHDLITLYEVPAETYANKIAQKN